jgi:hypothetical protein
MPGKPEQRPHLDSLGFYLPDRKNYVELLVNGWYNVVYRDKKLSKNFTVVAKVVDIQTAEDGTGIFTFRNLDGMHGRIVAANIISAVFRPPRPKEENPWTF